VWNAARFVLMNLRDEDACVKSESVDALVRDGESTVPLEDLWILHRMNAVSADISEALDKFRFHEASALIYQFIWHELCDWYIELVKPVLTSASIANEERGSRIQVLVHVMDCALRMLHPFMPFITEEIWQKLPHEGDSIMMQAFPTPREVLENPEAARKMQDLMELIGSMRALRAEMNISPKHTLDAAILIREEEDRILVSENIPKIQSLARLNNVLLPETLSGRYLRGVSKLGEFGLDVHDALNVQNERERLQKEIARTKDETDKVWKKLNSPEFISRAPEEIVAEIRSRHDGLCEKLRKIESNLNHLPVE
jgi:valyl-tRNA synthetase